MAREYTKQLLQMVEDGLLDKDMVIMACVNHMSDVDVRDMMEANEMVEEDEDALDDFNYVGSYHHY